MNVEYPLLVSDNIPGYLIYNKIEDFCIDCQPWKLAQAIKTNPHPSPLLEFSTVGIEWKGNLCFWIDLYSTWPPMDLHRFKWSKLQDQLYWWYTGQNGIQLHSPTGPKEKILLKVFFLTLGKLQLNILKNSTCSSKSRNPIQACSDWTLLESMTSTFTWVRCISCYFAIPKSKFDLYIRNKMLPYKDIEAKEEKYTRQEKAN